MWVSDISEMDNGKCNALEMDNRMYNDFEMDNRMFNAMRVL